MISSKELDRQLMICRGRRGVFEKVGFTWHRYVLKQRASRLHDLVLHLAQTKGQKRDFVVGGHGTNHGPRRRIKDILVPQEVVSQVPDIEMMYEHFRLCAQEITNKPILKSQSEASAFLGKVYSENDDQHGWHVEQNCMTAVLSLTQWTDGGPLEYSPKGHDRDSSLAKLFFPSPGEVSFMIGGEVWHRVPPLKRRWSPRVSLVFNFYFEGRECLRDKRFDELIGGEQ